MNCHHTVLRYGLQLERGLKRAGKQWRPQLIQQGSEEGGGEEDLRMYRAVRKTGKMRQRRYRRWCQPVGETDATDRWPTKRGREIALNPETNRSTHKTIPVVYHSETVTPQRSYRLHAAFFLKLPFTDDFLASWHSMLKTFSFYYFVIS